jgi:hypothetical protein
VSARTRSAFVAVETCTPAGRVHELCDGVCVRCTEANTACDQFKYKPAKRKSDRDDVLRLARLRALGQLPRAVVSLRRVSE